MNFYLFNHYPPIGKKGLCLILLVFGFLSVSAQHSILSGSVRDSLGRPLATATVSIPGHQITTITDSAGRFRITGLRHGKYEISVIHDGFRTVVAPISISDIPKAINVTLYPLSLRLAEVLVTDQHIKERKLTESLNVEIADQDFIQRNLGGSLMSTLSRLPGIKTIGIGSGQSKPLIRGLGFNRVVVVDKGVKHEGQQWGADHGLELDQFAAGEVELIKGAASFIYGSDAIGGVVDVKPAPLPAPNSIGGSLDLIGKTNNNLYGTSLNLFARNQRWFADGRLTYQNYGDYRVPTEQVSVYNFPVKLYNHYLRNTAGREIGLHINTGYITERFRSIFYISNVYNKSGFFANAHGLEPRQVNIAEHDASDRDILLPSQNVNHFKVINRSSYQAGTHLLQAELGYQRNYRQEFSKYVNHGYMPPEYPDTMSIPEQLERQFDKHVYSINLRDQIGLGKHELNFGINGEHQDNSINGWTFLVPAFKQSSAGGFFYDKFRISDRVLLHGAIRYDYGYIRMFKYTDWFESEVVESNDTVMRKVVRAENNSRKFHSLVWSAGINYNIDHLTFKANIGKSFRMPIAKELGANGVNYHYFSYERGDPALSPEQSYQADVSVGLGDEYWSIQLSPFYNYFPNYIYLNPTAEHAPGPGAGYQLFEYAQSRVMRYGGELQLKCKLLKDLSSEILAEYLYAKQLSGAKEGYTLPFSPPPSALVNLTWTPMTGNKFQNSYFSVDCRITAAQNHIVPPEQKSPGYQVVNIQTGTKVRIYNQPVLISLQGQNLLNIRYLNHTSFYRLIELPEAGRNIVVSLKVPFSNRITPNSAIKE